MSLVTRCPACATTFKVVRDQLRISDGWVRCGRCSQVFDATIDLQEMSETEPPRAAAALAPDDHPATAADTEPPAEDAVAQATRDAESMGDASEPRSPHDAPPLAGEAPAPVPEPPAKPSSPAREPVLADASWAEWDLPPLPAPAEPFVPPYRSLPPFPTIDLNLPASKPLGFRTPTTAKPIATPIATPIMTPAALTGEAANAGDVSLHKALRRARAKSAKIAKAKDRARQKKEKSISNATGAERASAPLVRAVSESDLWADASTRLSRKSGAADATAFWQRAAVRRSLAAVGVVAAVLLVLQVLHQERDAIVARQPSLRPALSALCDVTGCEISALRRIGDITIDGASFAREKSGEAYRLRFRLRSAATIPLAMPAIELTLLDTQERAVVRRVLMPAEFGAPPVLPARGEREASLQLTLAGAEVAALPPVAGYRVEALYP